MLAIVWVSFFDTKILVFPPPGYTLAWYHRAWATGDFRQGLVVSVEVGLVATAVSLLLGTAASLALVRARFPGRELVTQIVLAPLVVPGIVDGSALFIFFLEIESATDIAIAGTLPGLIVAHCVIALPWTVRLMTAALLGVSRTIEEAAENLGADPLTVFRRVTLPMIRPGFVAAALFAFVVSFIDLEKSLFLVGPGLTTLQIAILNYLEWNLDPTVAAVATVQIVIIAAALLLTNRYANLSRMF